jgi:hypothetical protein
MDDEIHQFILDMDGLDGVQLVRLRGEALQPRQARLRLSDLRSGLRAESARQPAQA